MQAHLLRNLGWEVPSAQEFEVRPSNIRKPHLRKINVLPPLKKKKALKSMAPHV
jgi:hypothetical protein